MKIVQLVFTLKPGGGEKFVVNLSNQLAEKGHDVVILQIRNDDNGEEINFNKHFISPKVKYRNLNLTRGFSIKKARIVIKSIRDEHPDILHSHLNVLPYFYYLTLLPIHTCFVHTLHNVALKETRNVWQRKLNKLLYKLNRIIPVTISKECRDSFVKTYHIDNPWCIDNGCPPINTTSHLFDVKKEIEGFKTNPESRIFLHVARYNEQKNQQMLISSFNKLNTQGVNAELIVIGAGFDDGEGGSIRANANEHIHFIGTRKNVGDYLYFSDYFILSSLWEGLPISLIEAMSAKVTPISTPAGGVIDVIQDGVSGFISPDFTEENFIKTIHRAMETPISKEIIFKNYTDHYSMEKCANEYLNVYHSHLKI